MKQFLSSFCSAFLALSLACPANAGIVHVPENATASNITAVQGTDYVGGHAPEMRLYRGRANRGEEDRSIRGRNNEPRLQYHPHRDWQAQGGQFRARPHGGRGVDRLYRDRNHDGYAQRVIRRDRDRWLYWHRNRRIQDRDLRVRPRREHWIDRYPGINHRRYADRVIRRGDAHYWRGYRGHRKFRPGYRRHYDWWFPEAAFITGAIVGSAINSQPYVDYGWSSAHVEWCYGRYRSYREWDNTFQPYHGPRRQCISPYWP